MKHIILIAVLLVSLAVAEDEVYTVKGLRMFCQRDTTSITRGVRNGKIVIVKKKRKFTKIKLFGAHSNDEFWVVTKELEDASTKR